jgi:hypothetical protein
VQRRLDTASVFERLFQVYGAQFTLIFPAAVLVFLPVAVISAAAGRGNAGGQIVAALLSTVATYWLQGMVVEAVRDIADGRRDFSVGGLFAAATPVLGTLILAGILGGIGIGIGFVLFIIPGLLLATWWAVLAPVIVIERRGAFEAFGRSRELVRGNGWQVFGVIVVVLLIEIVVSLLLGAVFSGADSRIGAALTTLLTGALIAPISAIAASIVYLDLSGTPVAGAATGPEVPPPAV